VRRIADAAVPCHLFHDFLTRASRARCAYTHRAYRSLPNILFKQLVIERWNKWNSGTKRAAEFVRANDPSRGCQLDHED